MAQPDSNSNKLTAIKKKGLFGSKDIVKVKAKIDIVVLTVQNLNSKLEGHEVWIKWKRGSRSSNSGETKKHMVRKGEAFLEESISFTTTLIQEAKTEKFETKKIELKVKEQKDKKDHSVGKAVTVDLATIAKKGTHETRSFPLEKGKKDSPILIVSFTTDWIKINGKKLTKTTGTSQIAGAPSGQKGETVRIDGEEYLLSPDDAPSMADTTAGDLSEDDDEASNAPPASPSPAPVAATAPVAASTSANAARASFGEPAAESSAGGDQAAILSAKLEKAKGKYKKAKERRKQDKAELERLQKALDERGANRPAMQSREVELLRTQLENLTNGDVAKQAVQLQLEVERLKEEQAGALRQAKRGSKAPTLSEDQAAMLKEVDALRAQVAEYKNKALQGTSAKADESAVLARDLSLVQAEVTDLKKEREALKEKLADQKKLAEAAVTERDTVKREAVEARTKMRMLQSQVDEHKDKVATLSNVSSDERQARLELEKLKAENKVLRFDREQYREKLAELERRARTLPGADATKQAAASEHNQFWMYAFAALFVLNLILIRYF